jgi:hypothetical protein
MLLCTFNFDLLFFLLAATCSHQYFIIDFQRYLHMLLLHLLLLGYVEPALKRLSTQYPCKEGIRDIILFPLICDYGLLTAPLLLLLQPHIVRLCHLLDAGEGHKLEKLHVQLLQQGVGAEEPLHHAEEQLVEVDAVVGVHTYTHF